MQSIEHVYENLQDMIGLSLPIQQIPAFETHLIAEYAGYDFGHVIIAADSSCFVGTWASIPNKLCFVLRRFTMDDSRVEIVEIKILN